MAGLRSRRGGVAMIAREACPNLSWMRNGDIPHFLVGLISVRHAAREMRNVPISRRCSMAISIVRLGSPRASGEGLRIGTVRRPPRGVPKVDWARRDFYDVWLPTLAPSEALLKLGQSAQSDAQWKAFKRRYLAEMKNADTSRLLHTLAAPSRHGSFAVGCYCENEARCHRSLLRELLAQRGADVRAL